MTCEKCNDGTIDEIAGDGMSSYYCDCMGEISGMSESKAADVLIKRITELEAELAPLRGFEESGESFMHIYRYFDAYGEVYYGVQLCSTQLELKSKAAKLCDAINKALEKAKTNSGEVKS